MASLPSPHSTASPPGAQRLLSGRAADEAGTAEAVEQMLTVRRERERLLGREQHSGELGTEADDLSRQPRGFSGAAGQGMAGGQVRIGPNRLAGRSLERRDRRVIAPGVEIGGAQQLPVPGRVEGW